MSAARTNAGRVVPPNGATARLVTLGTATMGFLAVFALALALALIELGQRWQLELSGTATLRLSGPAEELGDATDRALALLETTRGINSLRVVPELEQRALLAPWFGRDLPLGDLPLPRIIEIETGAGFDGRALRLRLAGEVPLAHLDDHDRWRAPLAEAQRRLVAVVIAALALLALTMAAVTALAARASLAANAQTIDVLRLVGARDVWIAKAFVRRLTLRAALGALLGTAVALGLLFSFPETGFAGLPALRPDVPLLLASAAVVPFSALVAFFTTRFSALRLLKGQP